MNKNNHFFNKKFLFLFALKISFNANLAIRVLEFHFPRNLKIKNLMSSLIRIYNIYIYIYHSIIINILFKFYSSL